MVLGWLCRILTQIFGWAWPAYQCYKAIQANNSEAIRAWCIYWFVLALFTLAERVSDLIVFWIPLYYEAKLLFVIWLWHPQTRGAISLYEKTVQPLLSHYEPQIDQFIAEGRGIVSDAFSANIGKVIAWLQEKGSIAFTRLQDVQQKPPSGTGRYASSAGMHHGNGQGNGPAAASAENLWTSSRRTAQAAMDAFSRQKHD